MSQILVPDFDATIEVDPELERLEWELSITGFTDRTGSEGPERRHEPSNDREIAQGRLDDYKKDPVSTRLIIGYLPAEKMTEIKFRSWEAYQTQNTDGSFNADQARAIDEVNRRICMWGVRGWKDMQGPDGKPFPFEGCKPLFGNAGPRDMRVLDHMGWLVPMAKCIWRYNTLDESKKKR